jgi:peptidyl-prolyl cis-trans isomerase B (cyclophilin B)
MPALLGGVSNAAPSPAWTRIVALEQARSLGDGELAADLASPDAALAVRAALAIGRTKQKAGGVPLEAHLGDPRAGVRAMSVYGLGLIADGRAAGRIGALSRNDPSSAVRAAALDAMGRYQAAGVLDARGQSQAAAWIVAALLEDPDATVRLRAAPELAGFAPTPEGFAASLALVAAFRSDPDVRVRRNVMWTIFRAYATRVPRALLTKALRDRDEGIRIEAVRAYGRLKNRDAMAALRPLLDDPSWRVQEQTDESLLALAGKPTHDSWTAIPASVHLPSIAANPLDAIAALPRTSTAGKPIAPTPADAIDVPKLDPQTAAQMSGPASGAHPSVRIVTTKGDVYVTLFPEWAPLTVANFLNVADRGYYDNNRWFRIVPDFVVQTGDPTDNGDGDAGYSIGAEENPLEQQTGVISMGMNYDAGGAMRDSAGTQYYITLSPQLHLDRDFTVFGQVRSGFDVLAHLVQSDRIIRVERLPDVIL